MAARDDFGSNAGTPRGYGGGGFSGRAGGLGNGGVGGGMGGGMAGGGAGRNGGINSRTGLGTGKTMFGGMAMGRPGGPAMNPGAWGVRPQPQVSQGPMTRPARPGLLGNPAPAAVAGVNPVPENILAIEDVPLPPFQDPMSIYTTLTPPPAQIEDPYGYAWKPPKGMPMNPASPPNLGPRVAPAGYGWTEPYRAESFYNDPKHGFPTSGLKTGGSWNGGYGR